MLKATAKENAISRAATCVIGHLISMPHEQKMQMATLSNQPVSRTDIVSLTQEPGIKSQSSTIWDLGIGLAIDSESFPRRTSTSADANFVGLVFVGGMGWSTIIWFVAENGQPKYVWRTCRGSMQGMTAIDAFSEKFHFGTLVDVK